MRLLRFDEYGSIVPVIIVLALIVVVGLLIGVLGTILYFLWNSDTHINGLFVMFWGFIGVIVLLVLVFWGFAVAQRGG
jgi:hypothetical protein